VEYILQARVVHYIRFSVNVNFPICYAYGAWRRPGDTPETIRGWRVDQVLTSKLFGLETARPPDMEKLLMRRKELLTKSRLTKANQKEFEEINEKLGPIPTDESFEQAKKTMDLVEKSLKLIEKYQGTEP
jgi:hypothetical protein